MFQTAWRTATEAVRLRGRSYLRGLLERPEPRQNYSRWVDIQGWALPRAGDDELTIEVRLNRRVVTSLKTTVDRPDVRARYGRPNGPPCGFEGTVSLEGLSLPARSILTVAAVSARNPAKRRTLGLSVLRAAGATERMPRHAYKETWNAVSHTLKQARHSVAGTDDDAVLNGSGESTANDVVQAAGIRPTDRVLEIGCGVGRVGASLASRCQEWVGADVSTNMLAHARQALSGLSNVQLIELNGVDLRNVADRSFDVVYCTAVFMHLDEWDRYRYVCEAHRVLREGGRFYFDNFCLSSPDGWKFFEDMARMDPAARPTNISKASTPEELETYATKAGLQVTEVRRGTMFVTLVAIKPM